MVSPESKLGGKHHHVEIRDNNPMARVTTDAAFAEYFDPDVPVTHQRIAGGPGIDPGIPMELCVEFTEYGGGTLVRIAQGPYESSHAEYHATGRKREPNHLEDLLAANPGEVSR